MTTYDRIAQAVGSAASGLLIAAEGGNLPLPWWLKLAAAIIAPIALGSSAPVIRRNSLKTPKADKRGQIPDSEEPR